MEVLPHAVVVMAGSGTSESWRLIPGKLGHFKFRCAGLGFGDGGVACPLHTRQVGIVGDRGYGTSSGGSVQKDKIGVIGVCAPEFGNFGGLGRRKVVDHQMDGKPDVVKGVRVMDVEYQYGAHTAEDDVAAGFVVWSGRQPVARVSSSVGFMMCFLWRMGRWTVYGDGKIPAMLMPASKDVRSGPYALFRAYQLSIPPLDAIRTPQKYAALAQNFRSSAWQHLEKDDLPQASNKAWGLVAETVKDISAQHGYIIHTHRGIAEVLGELAGNFGDTAIHSEINRALITARQLHVNFYEDELRDHTVIEGLIQCEELSELLHNRFAVAGAPPV